MAEMPPFETLIRMEIVHRVPGMDAVAVRGDVPYKEVGGAALGLDVYGAPSSGTRPGVVLIHGGPIPRTGAKSMGVFQSYGRLLAASGFVAVTFDHRFLGPDRLLDAASDVADALAWVRDHAPEIGLDGDRLAVWAFSGGGIFLSLVLRDPAPCVRALLSYYAVLDLQEKPPDASAAVTDEMRRDFSPLHHLRTHRERVPPIFVARAGLDQPALNAGVDRFVQEALAGNVSLDLMNHPTGRHGFDILDDDARSREILARTVDFLRVRLS